MFLFKTTFCPSHCRLFNSVFQDLSTITNLFDRKIRFLLLSNVSYICFWYIKWHSLHLFTQTCCAFVTVLSLHGETRKFWNRPTTDQAETSALVQVKWRVAQHATSHYPNQWLTKIDHVVRLHWVISSLPNAGYMRQRTVSILLQVMACRLFGAKPLLQSMLIYY